jgi:CheY-like chemotaxis protein
VATEAQPAAQAKLLVVEDDALIRMLLADMLSEIGYTVAAEAASIDEALEATRNSDFDLALLDADLKGRSVSPVADALVARDIGFVFVTGSDHGLFAYRNRPTLRKPFQIDALKRCCTSALSSYSCPSACGDTPGRERGAGG